MRVLVVLCATAIGTASVSACTSSGTPPAPTLVIGAEASPGMAVLARIYGTVLRNAGAAVSHDVVTADYPTLLDGMDAARVDLFPARSGALLATLAPQLAPTTSEDVYDDLNRSLPQGVSVGDPTTVTAAPQLFVSVATAQRSGVTDLASCAQLPRDIPLVAAAAPDPRVVDAFTAAGCVFGPTQVVGSSAAVVNRLATGDAVGILSPLDVAGDNGSGPVSTLQALAATDGAGPRAEDLVPVYRTASLTRDQVKAINKVAGELTTADLATMADKLESGSSAPDLAATWLAEHGL